LGAVYKFFVRSFVSINRVNAIFSSESEVYQDAHTFALNSIEGKINFDRVSFRYPGMDDYVLKDISFTANPGEITAIAGASGAGKSTIIDLILRFILPTDGKIYLDKYNIRDISLLTLRANISIVSQEAVMFSGTVRENLIYGCVQPTREKLIGAANDAEIHDFILSLPQGYDTLIGGGGKGLSGGQLQRLTIARALLCDVKILVLDEATSALDAVIEEKIYENLKKRISSKTVIMISHRISSLKNADKIHVVSENRISESGTYNELLERKGDFYSFYIASTKGEREPAEEAIIRELMAKKAMQKEKRNLEQLSMAEKKVLKLYYEEGLSYGKIAQELGLPAYNVSAIRKAASDKIERLKELEIE
jgi:RNA polymerase sigma factor (sigma-70 family)